MLLERFVENEKKVMLLKPSEDAPMEVALRQSLFFAKKHVCDEYRLVLPRKTVHFDPTVTEEELHKTYQLLTEEEYTQLEHAVQPFSKEEWSLEEKQELQAFLFDLALLTKNTLWAQELYNQPIEN